MQSTCTDFFNCSLPEEERTNKHKKRFHEINIVTLKNADPSLPPIKIQRDPSKEMYFRCSHPDCGHFTISSYRLRQHYKKCKFLRPDREPVATAATTTPQHARSQRQNQRSHPYLKHQPKQATSSPSSTSPRPSSPESVANISTQGNCLFSDKTDILRHLLKSIDRLADTVSKLDKRLDRQTKNIKGINEKVDSLVEQVDELSDQGNRDEERMGRLVVANASLENHIESLFIDMDLMQNHLGDLFNDNSDLREQLSGVRTGVGRVDLTVNSLVEDIVASS